MTAGTTDTLKSKSVVRSRNYLIFLVIFMGWVALLDQYISMIKTTAILYHRSL